MFRATTTTLATVLLSLALSAAGSAQTTGYTFSPHPQFRRYVQLSPKAQNAMKQAAGIAPKGMAGTAATSTGVTIDSVPHWFSSFLGSDGNLYPYVMVGTKPTSGGTSTIPTPILPLKVQFEGDPIDPNTGYPAVYDAASIVQATEHSPNFEKAAYDSGYTQYGDAGQRATFWHGMKSNWHVLLSSRKRQEKTLTVPAGSYLPFGYYDSNNVFHFVFYAVDIGYWENAVQDLIQNGGYTDSQFPLVLTNGVYLYENFGGGNYGCCVFGYHTAYDQSVNKAGTKVEVQSYAWASWVPPGVFGGGVEDVFGISHEIAEWMNDPFPQPAMNFVRPWVFPDDSGCQGNLEVGDPIEVLANAAYPVNGYHPTNIALYQWFANDGTTKKSSALNQAYSWPDPDLLQSPAAVCPGY